MGATVRLFASSERTDDDYASAVDWRSRCVPDVRRIAPFARTYRLSFRRALRNLLRRSPMTPADPIPPPVTPEPLSEQELDELEGKLRLLTRSCQCEECCDERSAF